MERQRLGREGRYSRERNREGRDIRSWRDRDWGERVDTLERETEREETLGVGETETGERG